MTNLFNIQPLLPHNFFSECIATGKWHLTRNLEEKDFSYIQEMGVCTSNLKLFGFSYIWFNQFRKRNLNTWKWYTVWKVSVFGIILIRIFPHSDWMIRTLYLSVFSPNAGKYWPEWLRIRTLLRSGSKYLIIVHLTLGPVCNHCHKKRTFLGPNHSPFLVTML